MRQHGYLGQLPSSKRHVVECLVWASVLAVAASQALYRLIRASVPRRRAIPLLRWGAQFAGVARELLRAVVRSDVEQAGDTLGHLRRNAPDPNINRAGRALEPVFPGVPA
ncbi:MAG: hypothetical protein ACQEXJ_22460 [Myxococcota bacterium]